VNKVIVQLYIVQTELQASQEKSEEVSHRITTITCL